MKRQKENRSRAGGTLRDLARFTGKYWPLLALSMALSAAAVILQLYVPILFGDAIDRIAGAGRVDFSGMEVFLGRVLALAATAGLCTWAMSLLNNRITYRIV